MVPTYPAPGDRPIVADVNVPGVPPGWRTITCWCRTVKVCYGRENADRVADELHREHRGVAR